MHSKEKYEACLGFLEEIFTKSVHRGGVWYNTHVSIMELTSKAAAVLIAYTTDSIDNTNSKLISIFRSWTFLTNCPSMYLTLIFESLRYTRPLLPYTIHQYIKWSSSHTQIPGNTRDHGIQREERRID